MANTFKYNELPYVAREAALDSYADSKEPDWDWYVDSLIDDGILYALAKEKGIDASSCDAGFDWHHGRKTFDRVMPRGTFGFRDYLIEVDTTFDEKYNTVPAFRGRDEEDNTLILPPDVIGEFAKLYDNLCKEMLDEANGYLYGDFEPKCLMREIHDNDVRFYEDGSLAVE